MGKKCVASRAAQGTGDSYSYLIPAGLRTGQPLAKHSELGPTQGVALFPAQTSQIFENPPTQPPTHPPKTSTDNVLAGPAFGQASIHELKPESMEWLGCMWRLGSYPCISCLEEAQTPLGSTGEKRCSAKKKLWSIIGKKFWGMANPQALPVWVGRGGGPNACHEFRRTMRKTGQGAQKWGLQVMTKRQEVKVLGGG